MVYLLQHSSQMETETKLMFQVGLIYRLCRALKFASETIAIHRLMDNKERKKRSRTWMGRETDQKRI